jgi:type I restriction enzyme S subunit
MPGKYRAYPEYKNSDVEWLGVIPEHWELKRVKEIATLINGYPFDSKRFDSGKGTPLVRIRDINSSRTEVGFVGEVPPESLIKNNDILIGMDGDFNVAMWRGGEAALNQRVACVRANSYELKKFIFYTLPFNMKIVNDLTYFTTVKHLSSTDILKAKLSLPSMDELAKIIIFLDHETAKIDTLIEKQQQLIKLLKEKRQAVISHAVTKGLNPHAPMRDSGVEWLGEVPEHWVVAQLKFNTVEMQTGPFGSQLHAEDYIDDGIPFVNPAHMADGKIVPDSKVSVDEETWHRLKRHQLFEGDLIFARRGELGRCAIVTKDQEGWLCGTGSLKAKLNDRLVPEYSYLLITSDGVVSELSLESKGSTMDNLNTETLGRVRLPVPPIDEQRKVLDYVNDVSGKFRNLIDKASAAIELMKERRTALISAAVTGKIDVRHHASHPAGSANTMMEHNNDF